MQTTPLDLLNVLDNDSPRPLLDELHRAGMHIAVKGVERFVRCQQNSCPPHNTGIEAVFGLVVDWYERMDVGGRAMRPAPIRPCTSAPLGEQDGRARRDSEAAQATFVLTLD